jgi:DNA replicative helicase MCM subunit Mcm2 (Cdc46/Mcm family)
MGVDRLDFDEIMKIQNLMASRIAQESEVDTKIKILDIIQNLLGSNKRFVQVEEVLLEAKYEHISEQSAMQTLDELESDRMIAIVDGKLRMTY